MLRTKVPELEVATAAAVIVATSTAAVAATTAIAVAAAIVAAITTAADVRRPSLLSASPGLW